MAKQQIKKSRRRKPTVEQQPMLFDTSNYIWMAAGVGLILLGFLIMYLESEVRGFWSLYVSPVVVLAGFGVVAYSIMKKRSYSDTETEPSTAE
ncbi:MAG: DUF3098 domain-containing protein [Cyclonatronaceae bacterium]